MEENAKWENGKNAPKWMEMMNLESINESMSSF